MSKDREDLSMAKNSNWQTFNPVHIFVRFTWTFICVRLQNKSQWTGKKNCKCANVPSDQNRIKVKSLTENYLENHQISGNYTAHI